MAEPAESIGTATMDDAGTLYLFLRAESPDGSVGDAMFEYPRGHANYKAFVEHVGGLRPGEQKMVPPWK